MRNKVVALTDRQMRLLPILAAHFDLASSTQVVRTAVDAMIATCADRDEIFRTSVRVSDEMAETGVMPERLKAFA